MGGHGADVGERDIGGRGEDKGDRDHLLGDHHERVPTDQSIQGGAYPTLHGVLDRHHRGVEIGCSQGRERGVEIGCSQGRERGVDGDERDAFGVVGELGTLTKHHLGECACGTQESVSHALEASFPVRTAAIACRSSGNGVTSLPPSTTPWAYVRDSPRAWIELTTSPSARSSMIAAEKGSRPPMSLKASYRCSDPPNISVRLGDLAAAVREN